MTVSLLDLTNDELADEITTWAGRVAAGEARLLELIGEFDAREAWGWHGVLSCAHWLSWRLGMGEAAARERVRVARRLRELPALAAALAAGRVSYSQVRAITRVSEVLVEEDWILYARCMTGAQLERLVRAVNRATRPEQDAADPELASWQRRPRVRRTEDGLVHITLTVEEDEAQLVMAGLDRITEQLEAEQQQRGLDEQPMTWNDALVRLAVQALDAPGLKPLAVRERLRVQVDPVSGWGRLRNGELLPPGCVERPTGTFVPVDLTAFDAGRTSRDVPLPLRRFLGEVDGERCRFPGCTRVTRLHAHHVRFWSEGGPTDLANLVLVCSRHHTLIHSQGFQLVLTPDRVLTVRTKDDIPVPAHPVFPSGDAEELPGASAETICPQLHPDGIDWEWAVYVIANQKR